MFRTRTPLSLVASYQIPLDLHVLGLPLAFILSQDQTLHCISFPKTYSLFNIQYISPSLYIFYLGRISSIFNVLLYPQTKLITSFASAKLSKNYPIIQIYLQKNLPKITK